ncbi:hypothetical protein C8034_v002600 [Colletotrichum sidae]|uniref:Uncharacterized protein n=2 Tax=Colletotrichum orbiculare species complex TaxID=2707354 RepID=A0A4R8Q835_9PEZI|nr:hypothetical protein C8035_v001302 [Colletotrichum spinosum]TEA15163.1 hypothetical protein C8034_v002600 [Colletotrichum sidae]
MSRGRSNRRSKKHIGIAPLETDSRQEGRVRERHHQKNHGGNRRSKHRGTHARSEDPRRHGKRQRDTDTDGDFSMLPSPPLSPPTSPELRPIRDVVASRKPVREHPAGHHQPSERRPKASKRTIREQRPERPYEMTCKNMRFREQVLYLLDQQRVILETWADSVGASGPAEPMDWQPEPERIIYFVAESKEESCYTERWRSSKTNPTPGDPDQDTSIKDMLYRGPMVVETTPEVELGSVADGVE